MENKYTITKEQLRQLTDPVIKEWFPDVFEKELVVGKWYWRGEELAIWNDENCTYGFVRGKFVPYILFSVGIGRQATKQEVETALINEAKKRGFKEGVWAKTINGTKKRIKGDLFFYFKENKIMSMFDFDGMNGLIFHNGKWAEIIPTITQEEAEEKFNIKII